MIQFKILKLFLGSVPRQTECFSCMSLGYKDNWEHLQYMYTTPKVCDYNIEM